jgi:hypothetical protein
MSVDQDRRRAARAPGQAPETAGTCDDLLVAYPTVDRGALRALAADDRARQHITIMTDSEAHLDVVDRAPGGLPAGRGDGVRGADRGPR